MAVYLNLKTYQGVETIDELNRKDFNSLTEFWNEKRRLKKEYQIASSYYNGVYWSQRPTNDWKNK